MLNVPDTTTLGILDVAEVFCVLVRPCVVFVSRRIVSMVANRDARVQGAHLLGSSRFFLEALCSGLSTLQGSSLTEQKEVTVIKRIDISMVNPPYSTEGGAKKC